MYNNSHIFSGSDGNFYKMELRIITPNEAQKILDNTASIGNVGRVKTAPARAKKYAKDMLAGSWRINGSVIILNSKIQSENGLHRLTACVNSKKPFETFVFMRVDKDGNILDLDPETILTIDTGKERSNGDLLKASVTTPTNKVENIDLIAQTAKRIIPLRLERISREIDIKNDLRSIELVKKEIEAIKITNSTREEKQEAIRLKEGKIKEYNENIKKTQSRGLSFGTLNNGGRASNLNSDSIFKEYSNNADTYNDVASLSHNLYENSNRLVPEGVIAVIAAYIVFKGQRLGVNTVVLFDRIKEFFKSFLSIPIEDIPLTEGSNGSSPEIDAFMNKYRIQRVFCTLSMALRNTVLKKNNVNKSEITKPSSRSKLIAIAWNNYVNGNGNIIYNTMSNQFSNKDNIDFDIV